MADNILVSVRFHRNARPGRRTITSRLGLRSAKSGQYVGGEEDVEFDDGLPNENNSFYESSWSDSELLSETRTMDISSHSDNQL
ncbi:hypothetical protein GCK72_025953 [Caenorhabditis remanei]|uniref:Uncharacterized protein n=1 Tax=Caenorhabditis remanei TaxID=31234 RepID=A0A6A5G451_CAERE|nr:hypothetical protein GCK72_025953 [Caenorhabditis remanei]KAF1749485.1 hypothetical protein GCK72_025953 [Caenorhabditis remanei]